MSNGTNTVFINLPVGAQVVKNVTHNFETHLLKMLLQSIQRLDLPSTYYNVFTMIIVICIALFAGVAYFVKYQHHFLCRRRYDETQHDTV